MAIKVLIDSAADINLEESKKMEIEMIPIVVSIDEKDYYDEIDLLPDDFYRILENSNAMPKTTQINPFRFEEKFKEMTKNGDQVICITISSKLSGTFNSAKLAAEKFNGKVFVIDSLNACAGERILCNYALDLISKNFSIENIVEELNKAKHKIKVIAMIDTLEYLKRGGRISTISAIVGSTIKLKPIIGVVEGEVKTLSSAVGIKRGIMFINSLIKNGDIIDFSKPVGLLWSGTNRINIEKYIETSKSIWKNKINDISTYIVGTTIGTHVGPGAFGIAFFEK